MQSPVLWIGRPNRQPTRKKRDSTVDDGQGLASGGWGGNDGPDGSKVLLESMNSLHHVCEECLCMIENAG